MVEPQPTPLAGVLGERIGELVARLHRAEGVDVRTGVGVAEVRGTSHVDSVILTDGTIVRSSMRDVECDLEQIAADPALEPYREKGKPA